MKKRPLFSLLTGSLLIFSGGCGFLPGGGDGETDVSSDTQEMPPPQVPLAAVRPLPPVDMAALGLIPPVLPDQRLREIRAGRANPFELIPVEAKIRESVCQLDPPKPGEANGAKQTKTNGGSVTTTTTTATSATPSTPGTVNLSPSPTAPPPLFPNDARAVVVSGVIEIGSRPYAIVQAPGEPVARNVTVGDRLSGGRVRVKAINPFGAPPNVVLEQYGDSVTRDVGSPALPPLTPPTSPTAAGSPLDAEAAMEAFGQGFVQILGAMAQEMGGTVTTTTQNTNTTRTVPLRGPEGDGIGYGEIRNLAVLKLAVNERGGDLINSVGVLCNAGQETLEVRRLTFQVEDATDNTILDSIQIGLARPYLLQKGQKLEFDGNAPRFRGRSPQDVIVKLVDWGSQQTQTASN
ncbi:hypothetical protein [Synechocystis sp. FACHB-383]|uniref:hypothetical protein n=1 Tax=Synechocystis sp. FACHB-383 TaxID=2692864 RepID=UPI001F555F1D|nr:hypothetical protein [Synechocystis sp. FACHB-383]